MTKRNINYIKTTEQDPALRIQTSVSFNNIRYYLAITRKIQAMA